MMVRVLGCLMFRRVWVGLVPCCAHEAWWVVDITGGTTPAASYKTFPSTVANLLPGKCQWSSLLRVLCNETHLCCLLESELCCLIQSPASSLIVTCETESLISLKQCLQLMVTKDAGVSSLVLSGLCAFHR